MDIGALMKTEMRWKWIRRDACPREEQDDGRSRQAAAAAVKMTTPSTFRTVRDPLAPLSGQLNE